VTGIVVDPTPPWACPGFDNNGEQQYFSTNGISDVAEHIVPLTRLTVRRPTAADCVPVTVTDDAGTPLRNSSLVICPLALDGTPCASPTSSNGPDAAGIIRLQIDPHVTYRLQALVADSGWPCPAYTDPNNGAQFHFSAQRDIVGADLIGHTTTFTIHHPSADECAPPSNAAVVTVVDDTGTPLPSAGMFVCPLAADGTPCPGPSFDGPDPDGVTRLDNIDPGTTYRLQAFITNSGWPCPSYTNPSSGDYWHFSAERDIVGADLIGHTTTFTIHHPTPDECQPPPPG
jgi:hypothetical protein